MYFISVVESNERYIWLVHVKKTNHYMTSSVSGKMNRISHCDWLALSRKENLSCFCVLSHIIINPLLTELVLSRWLDIGLILFLRVYGP